MLDTIVLTLDQRHFEVLAPERFSPSAKGLLTPPYYPLGSRGNFACVQNPTKSDLRAGHYQPRLTLSKYKTYNRFALTLRVEFSAPKMVLGNNFDELTSDDFRRVQDVLHRRLDEMGIRLSTNVLCSAPVSAIHYSKNIALTDYTTCSMVLGELARIDVTKRLDLSHTTYRNEGHAIRHHANSFDILFYDKLRDLERARYSEKRGVERDYGANFEFFRRRASLPKELEVLRLEIRLGKRAKIKSVLEDIGENARPSFEALFDANIAKSVIGYFWNQIRVQHTYFSNNNSTDPEVLLARLAAMGKGLARPGKLLQQLGTILLIDSVGVRGAEATMRRHCSPRSWQRYMRELRTAGPDTSNRFSALKVVDEALSRFDPLRIERFSLPIGKGNLNEPAIGRGGS
jgi:hypothetical protein